MGILFEESLVVGSFGITLETLLPGFDGGLFTTKLLVDLGLVVLRGGLVISTEGSLTGCNVLLHTIGVSSEGVDHINRLSTWTSTFTTITGSLEDTLPEGGNWIRISGEIRVGFKEGLDISMSRFSCQTSSPLS